MHLFTDADLVTRGLSIMLVLMSLWSWAIIVEKALALRAAKAASAVFEHNFWSGGSLDVLYESIKDKSNDPMAAMFAAAMDEWKKSAPLIRRRKGAGVHQTDLASRVEKAMDITAEQEITGLEARVPVLSIVGSTAPLMGLFGTVWGIMESFSAIGTSGGNALNIVAPGVASALATTALGLIVAIPAVVGYNKIYNDIARYSAKLSAFAGEFSSIISRQIDEAAHA